VPNSLNPAQGRRETVHETGIFTRLAPFGRISAMTGLFRAQHHPAAQVVCQRQQGEVQTVLGETDIAAARRRPVSLPVAKEAFDLASYLTPRQVQRLLPACVTTNSACLGSFAEASSYIGYFNGSQSLMSKSWTFRLPILIPAFAYPPPSVNKNAEDQTRMPDRATFQLRLAVTPSRRAPASPTPRSPRPPVSSWATRRSSGTFPASRPRPRRNRRPRPPERRASGHRCRRRENPAVPGKPFPRAVRP
jgi:hypothetical protein